MCGITGFISERDSSESHGISLETMVAAISHRGPDSSGEWVDPERSVWLGHARLAIQDISPAGHQPMVSPSGNLVLTYNGEIYNHQAIRDELNSESPHQWKGTSDTETLLTAIETWGLDRTLVKARGMFAFALYDQSHKTLTLVRDRFGEKPLYYGFQGSDFLFASDLAALVTYPSFRHEVDREALAQYFRYGYVPSPASIYQGIQKLLPGHFVTLQLDDVGRILPPKLTQYWSYPELLTKNQTLDPPPNAVTLVHDTLRSVVADQMISDVPIGTFLSGGLDSSVVTALAQENSAQPINTYTIGSPSQDLDESGYAREVARVLGTRHTEFQVTDSEARQVLPLMGGMYSEPFADSSQVPTSIVSSMARGEVTVALTGDGGDEIFGGYNRYTRGLTTWRQIRQIPRGARQGLGKLLLSRSPENWAQRFRSISNNGARWGVSNLENKIEKLGAILSADTLDSYYATLTEKWRQSPLVGGLEGGKNPLLSYLNADLELDDARRLMLVDALTYLPDDILVKVDRASMAVGLETRAPFLDLRVAETAATLRTASLLNNKSGKAPLRQILEGYLPDTLINRPKLGFGIPLGHWLRGPLRAWVEELIDPDLLTQQGFLNPALVHDIWGKHLAGAGNTEEQVWAVLVFQLWLNHNPKAH
jgi:asparagine synthase (glutamine-hydrolysing)